MSLKSIVALAVFACAAPALASEGGAGSHGGDTLVSEFTGSARNLLKTIADLGSPPACPSAASLGKAIQETKVYSSPVVYIEGREHDARNDPQKGEIEISRVRMLNQNDDINYLTVNLHEYLGILGREDTNTTDQSQACLSALAMANVDLKRLRYRTGPITSFEDAILNGHARIYCETPAQEKVVFVMEAPTVYDSSSGGLRNAFDVSFLRANGSRGRYYKSVHYQYAKAGKPFESSFRLEYSIQTGTATWVFESEASNYGGARPAQTIRLSTSDHAAWKLDVVAKKKKDESVSATCAFSFTQ